MPKRTLLSIIESPTHPNFSGLYRSAGITEIKVASMRKAISRLKTTKPDFVVAEFFYGYGNNYAGVNLSNLDVFLYSLQRYAPEARVIVLVDKGELEYVEKLGELFSLYAVLQQPVAEQGIAPLLEAR
jgi:hypothetical protein